MEMLGRLIHMKTKNMQDAKNEELRDGRKHETFTKSLSLHSIVGDNSMNCCL
jgi:hypothetical protein